MNNWNTLYSHLKNKGFSVYSPGQHKGECLSPYVVARFSGRSPVGTFTSTQDNYELMCYVPRDKYSLIQQYSESVKEAMRGLYPLFVLTGFETAAYYDDTVKAHMVSIEYRNMVQNKPTLIQDRLILR